MKGDAKVVEFLNKALRHELTAVNQYWLHYRLLDNWGYKDLAKQWRKESIEEMEHADKLVERIIFLDGFPNMQVLDPLHVGQHVKEVLDCDLAAEISARALYQEAATYCHSAKDYVTRELLVEIIAGKDGRLDDTTVSRALEELYALGIKPDWWKLEPQASSAAWANIEATIRKNDPYCRGVVLLGLEAPQDELEAAFAATAGVGIVKGFAVGRTLFASAAEQWFSGKSSDEEAVADMAERFEKLTRAWLAVRGREAA